MKCNVAVTGLNATDNPAPGVAVMRSLREEPEWSGRIIGLSYDAYEPGNFDPALVNAVYLLPYPKSGRQAFLDRIESIHQREAIEVLFPNLDSELTNMIEMEPQLSALGIKTFLPTMEQFKRRSKAQLPALARELSLANPESKNVTDLREAERVAEELEYPVMVKGLFYEAYLAGNHAELHSLMQLIASRWGYPIIIQKYVPGEEINLTGLGDGNGNLVSAVCMKKVFVTDKGKGWAGISIMNHELLDAAERSVRLTKWRGGFELEALIAEDEVLHLIEINPRFPAWIYLAKACGINLPYASCLLALGKRPDLPLEYETGIMFVHYTTDLVASVKQIESLMTRRELQY